MIFFKQTLKFLMLFTVLLITSLNVFSASITSIVTGDWNNTSTWSSGTIPGVNDDVTITTGHTVTLNQDVTIISLTVDGTFVIGNDATSRNLIITGTSSISNSGTLSVGLFDITHYLIFQGVITNNGTFDLYNSSNQVADVTFDASTNFAFNGNAPQFNNIKFINGTLTAGVDFDINGAVIIENGATFAGGNFVHNVAGNWTVNGTGARTGAGTIQMDATFIQSITTPASFHNLTYNGAGIGVLGANVNITNDFLVTNNTKVQTSQQHIFENNFTVDNGSLFKATAGRATFNSSLGQTIFIGTTNSNSNVEFHEAYFDNGNTNHKIINGSMIVNGTFYLFDDAGINDIGNDKNHKLHNAYFNGTCNFSGTITAMGGSFSDTDNDDFSLGTANIVVQQYLYVSTGDKMTVGGDLTVGADTETYGSHLVITNNSELVGTNGATLLVKDGKSLYIRGSDNFPSNFGTYTLENLSFVRYDENITQNIKSDIVYGRLYINNRFTDGPYTKTASGDLTVNNNVYLYNKTTLDLQNHSHTFGGHIINSDDINGNSSVTSSAGGTLTLSATDTNQYIYDAGTGTYTFNNLIITNTAPTSIRYKRIYNNITVNGDLTITNTGGDVSNRLYFDMYAYTIIGGTDFNLGANVWLLTNGLNSFETSIASFLGTKNLDLNSTIRFNSTANGSSQNIPGGFTYGNIELFGSNEKQPQANLDINGNMLAVGYTPILTDNSHTINIAGDWNMSLNTTSLTGINDVIFDGVNQDISQSNFADVFFANSGTKTISGNINVLNNLQIETNVIVNNINRNINIKGNWIEIGSAQFAQIAGTVTFDGTTANQTINANSNSNFYNLTINKAGANKLLTINTDIIIKGTFNFTENNADFDMNSNNIYVARDFYFRNGCTFNYNGGKAFFNGTSTAQLIRNYNTTIVFGDVEFLGTAVKRLYQNSFKFEGDVFINNSTLDGQWYNHYVEGNWINTGIFRHSSTIHFNGSKDQTISQSNFHTVRFGDGDGNSTSIFTKTLTGDINLTGNLWIDDATLDVSASNYNITLDDYWHNDSTGTFLPHEGTVTVTGEYNRIFTGKTNTLFGTTGQVNTQGGIKDFYNLTINATNQEYWMFIHGNLTVENNFEIIKGHFYQSYDPNTYGINDIYIGGNFINKGAIYNNNYGSVIELNPTSAADYVLDPGNSNSYDFFNFNGVAGSKYTLESNLNLYSGKDIIISNGDIVLNSNKIMTSGAGDITINDGSLEVDSAAIISMGNGSTLSNAGGIFKLVGHVDNPASLIASSGNFTFVQTAGTIHANNYRIEGTSANGIDIQGGSIDAINTFQNGSFSGGIGTAYLTNSRIDLGSDRTITEATFNTGPQYNVQRTSGNGEMNFENATGTLAGENYDNDPGTFVNWTYPGAALWTGAAETTDWHTANNWLPVAVPTSSTFVILDHSTVSGAYSVVISSAIADASSLFINSGSNAISLIINGQELTVLEDITISSNSSLTQTNSTDLIKLGGAWSNQGTFNPGTATVEFNPTSGTHTITTKAGDTFYNFTLNGTGGTNIISSALDINGNVNLISGTINSGTNTITVAGNWTRNGIAIFNYGTGTVNFDNNGNQTINGGEFYNFITSNSGTKTVTANIDINNNITIHSGTIFDGSTNTIYIGHDWINNVGNTGFTQTGAGTVIFDGRVTTQHISNSNPTTFNNIIFTGTQAKHTTNDITINGNLVINSASLYIDNGTTINGVGGSNSLDMSGGRIYVNGPNNFPQNFETINLSAGTVDYFADLNQTIYPTTYYALMLRRINSGTTTTKTLTGDITVNNSLYIYDNETLLNVADNTINLWGNLSLATGGIQINWGTNGTLIHFGENITVDEDITKFNNVIKKNRGQFRILHQDIEITGNMSIIEDAYLRQDEVNINCTGANKTFTLAATAAVYSYNPETLGLNSGQKAFPINFANYSLHKDSRVYISGTSGDQVISTVPVYGNLYINTNAAINVEIDGNIDVNGSFRMYSNSATFIDNGNNINIEGNVIDIRKYTPSNTTTITFDGENQGIYDAGVGATIFDMNNVVFAGSGQKSLHLHGDDYYNITGNLIINSGVTVYIPRRLDFSGTTWANNGFFNNTAYIVNFIGASAQTIDPGVENNFYAVSFSNSGQKTFINNGIDVNNGTFTLENGTTVNMGSSSDNLIHYIASERITNNGGTWVTTDANFIWDRNATQYIPEMTAKNFTFRKYDQWNRIRYLIGEITINDMNIEAGIHLRCSSNGETSTPAYNVIMTGNYTSEGRLYAYANTFNFESNDGLPKTIKQGLGSFDNVSFNQTQTNSRIYTLISETRFYEDMLIGSNATLDLNGQILRLGNDDANDPVEPDAEEHTIQSGGTLDVDAGASLLFSCRDQGNPILNVDGTLKIVGADGENANISSTDWHIDTHRIDININDGATIFAQYYLMKYLSNEGLYIHANATIDATNNFSNGTWSDLNTSGGTYLHCNADVSSIGNVNNVTFNYSGTPSAGTHFNVKRDNTSTGTLAFDGSISGLLGGETFEADPTTVVNPGNITWPTPTEAYWTGTVDIDWFKPGNWSTNSVPDNSTNAIIPIRANNPTITGNDAVCKNLQITNGFLTMKSGWDIAINGNIFIGDGSIVGILAIEDANSEIALSGDWTRGQNALFVHGNSTVNFNATGGSVSIDARNSEFGNLTFSGAATFMLNRQETFIAKNLTISNGTLSPIVNNYSIKIKGDYNNSGGIFETTTVGTTYFNNLGNQTITNGTFWHMEIDGSGTKSTVNSCLIDGNLLMKNATFQAGGTIDMNNYVTIQAQATFNDGGFIHTFSGARWTGTGTYTGTGIIEFDRDNSQSITTSTFNSLLFKNIGAITLEGDINMTGNLSLIDPNMYLNAGIFQITNTSGTGTFSMADNRRIYLRAANNFPVNFGTYTLHKNSYSIYDGTTTQTIAPFPITYGRLYLDNGNKVAAGNLDINGVLYFYDDASLDVTTNNYRINIEGDWHNASGATFIPHEGEVIFDGSDDYTYLRIYQDSKDSNPFYKLTINKSAGELRSYWADITIQDNLRVINGILYQSHTMFVGGDMSAFSGTFGTAGTYYLKKANGSSNFQLNGSVLNNLTINSGATYILQDNLELNGNYNLIAGTFEANGQLVRMGNYGEVNEISGLYNLGAGGILKLPNYGIFRVNSGGEIRVVGDANNIATVTNNTGRYYFNIENGATIRARNYLFEYMSEAGIFIKDGGSINENYNFSFGTFANSVAGGTCLRIENNQDFTEANGFPITEISFPYNPGGGASNVTKMIAAGGVIDFKDFSGEFGGEDFDNDPNDLLNWVSPPFVMWTGVIDNDWYKIGNWDVNFGPDRIPLITDNVLITQKTNQPEINSDGALAKSISININAILTLNTNSSSGITLEVAEDIDFAGTITMNSNANTIRTGGNWNNTGMFTAGQGTVTFNSSTGLKSIDNFNNVFYNLQINSVSDIQLIRNTTVNNDFTIINGNLDLTANNRIFTVKGDFNNYDNFTSRNGKLTLAGTGANQIFNPGSSSYYNIDIDANASVDLINNDLSIIHNMNINSGNFNLNSRSFNMGDGLGTDILNISGGTITINENAYLRPANNSAIEVNSGNFIILGTFLNNAFIESQSGNYSLSVNSGATIHARYYNIQNTDINGVTIKAGALINVTNNFSDGIWQNGSLSGQYLNLENTFTDFTVTNVYFNNGASVNVKRTMGAGIITFEDALGSLAGYQYENDDNSATTGLVQWTYTHPQNNWIGGVSTEWDNANNWGLTRVPLNTDAAIIPDIDESTNFNPTLGITTTSSNGVCYDLLMEAGAYLTINNDKNIDIDNTVIVNLGATIEVITNSASAINVGDIWSVNGNFIHGGNSTVIFDATTSKMLNILSNGNFYNLNINSFNTAEYQTASPIGIDGNFSINTGIFTVLNSGDILSLKGNYTNAGTFNHGNSNFVFNGTNQSITNNGAGNFFNLYLEGSETKTLASNITIENDININTGVSLNSGVNLTLMGDWINRGTFIHANGSVYFSGAATQLVNNYSTETFYNFILNNSSTSFPQVVLYGDLFLTGTNWTMTNGIIETTNNEMITIEQNIVLSGGNTSASYVSGPITKIGNSDFTFPIGDGLKFARLAISNLSNNTTFIAQYFESPYTDLSITSPLDHVSGYEHWTLNRTNGTDNPIVTFYWEDGSQSGIDKLSSLTTALYVNPDWEDRRQASVTGTIAQGSISSSTAFATFGACGFGSLDADNPLNGYSRWTGQISTVWNNPNNWTMGVPSSTADALIPSAPAFQPIINIDAQTNKLTIDQGASLNINPLKSLTTEGNLIINGAFRLNSDITGNASFINNSGISYGTNCDVVTELYLSGFQYHHVSSPTTSTHSDRFKVDPVTPNHNPNFYSYDETDLNSDWTATAWHEFTGTMPIMDAYTTYFDRNPTILFDQNISGDFNTGDKSKNLTYTGASAAGPVHRGWNFVGNPYPANIDWDAANWTKTNIHNSIYFWNGTNYSYYVSAGGTSQDNNVGTNNGTSIIPPMQGYFVKVIGDDASNLSGSLTTPVSARTTSSHAFYKNNKLKNEIDIIRLHVSGNDKQDETVVRFLPEASSGFDSNYDAYKLFPSDWYGVPMIYSVLNDNLITSINTLASYYDELTVPIGFQSPTSGVFTIDIPVFSLDKSTEIFFEDIYDNKIFDITNGLTYNFSSDAGQFDDRFRILFSVTTDVKDVNSDKTDVNIYSYGTDIYLKSAINDAVLGNVQIINMFGAVVYHSNNSKEALARISFNKHPAGTYIVKLTNKYGVFIEKVFVMK